MTLNDYIIVYSFTLFMSPIFFLDFVIHHYYIFGTFVFVDIMFLKTSQRTLVDFRRKHTKIIFIFHVLVYLVFAYCHPSSLGNS